MDEAALLIMKNFIWKMNYFTKISFYFKMEPILIFCFIFVGFFSIYPEDINYIAQQIVRGKSIKEIEEEFKNSDEFKKLPYWQDDE